MKSRNVVMLSLLAGVAIGAGAVQGLHAQARPPAYVVAEVSVTNPDAFAKEYAPAAGKVLTEAGGKYLARGGKTVTLDGDPPPNRVTIIAFDNVDKAKAAFTSAAYHDLRKTGDKYATFRIFIVEGTAQ